MFESAGITRPAMHNRDNPLRAIIYERALPVAWCEG
jgi:hypothetical protein